MSSSLLRKSLAICDPDLEQKTKSRKKVKKDKLPTRVTQLNKEQTIKSDKKITVGEAREKLKAKKKILQQNLTILKLRKKASGIKLRENTTERIIERAVTRKPIKSKPIDQTDQQTAFTEEDFKKFEEEYYDE